VQVNQRPPIQASNQAAKSAKAKGRRRFDIAEVAGAVSSRNIHAAAEGDGEMRIIATDAGLSLKSLRGTASGAGVLVVEADSVQR
jgi:hypothetical protein